MNDAHNEITEIYMVVVNQEEQYSIWPVGQPPPAGWMVVGKTGPAPACLEYIKEIWTDMRPLSLRRRDARPTPADEARGA